MLINNLFAKHKVLYSKLSIITSIRGFIIKILESSDFSYYTNIGLHQYSSINLFERPLKTTQDRNEVKSIKKIKLTLTIITFDLPIFRYSPNDSLCTGTDRLQILIPLENGESGVPDFDRVKHGG